jgi:hypothetical protein
MLVDVCYEVMTTTITFFDSLMAAIEVFRCVTITIKLSSLEGRLRISHVRVCD